MELSLVIPAYNEEERIRDTLEAVSAYFARQSYPAEVIVVDDGSTDATAEVVRAWQEIAEVPLTLKSMPENRGKGQAVRTGMLDIASGRHRFFFDADASTPIEELDRCHGVFEDGADIIIGSRALPESQIQQRQVWYRERMGRCFNHIERLLAITEFKDTQCGFKGFTAAAAEICFSRQTIEGFSFDAEILFIARKHGLRVAELPVHWINSPKSRVNPITDASRMFMDLFAIRAKELAGRYD